MPASDSAQPSSVARTDRQFDADGRNPFPRRRNGTRTERLIRLGPGTPLGPRVLPASRYMVEPEGVEPSTFSMPRRRAPAAPRPHIDPLSIGAWAPRVKVPRLGVAQRPLGRVLAVAETSGVKPIHTDNENSDPAWAERTLVVGSRDRGSGVLGPVHNPSPRRRSENAGGIRNRDGAPGRSGSRRAGWGPRRSCGPPPHPSPPSDASAITILDAARP